jgi:hypothetical protein
MKDSVAVDLERATNRALLGLFRIQSSCSAIRLGRKMAEELVLALTHRVSESIGYCTWANGHAHTP